MSALRHEGSKQPRQRGQQVPRPQGSRSSEGLTCWRERPTCRALETTVRVLFCAHLAGQVHIWKWLE